MKSFLFYLGTAAGFVLPLCNIPLILKIRQSKSSREISVAWAIGTWTCIFLMFPQALLSPDWSFKIFGSVNFILFCIVLYHVWRYRL